MNRLGHFFILTGVILILTISAIHGFDKTALDAAQHLISDLTKDLLVHTYLAGFVLVIIGCYMLLKNKYGTK